MNLYLTTTTWLLMLAGSAASKSLHGDSHTIEWEYKNHQSTRRRLRSSDDSSGSVTGTDRQDDGDSEAFALSSDEQCGVYHSMFDAMVQYQLRGDAAAVTSGTNKCAFCWPRCGALKDDLCPETCESMVDAKAFCNDSGAANDSGSGSESESGSRTGSGQTGLCTLQCIEFVSKCCPCGTEICLVDFRGNQVIDRTISQNLRFFNYEAGVSPFVTLQFIEPGTVGLGTGGLYQGPHYITGTIASDSDNAFIGFIGTNGVGLVYNQAGSANDEGCVTIIFPASVPFQQAGGTDNNLPSSSNARNNFLYGVSGCDSQITRIEYTTRLTTEMGDMEFEFILNDSKGWHIGETRTGERSGEVILADEKWKDFIIGVNLDEHHAGLFGKESTPSYECVKNVGARICASVGGADLTDTAGATFSEFKVYGRGGLLD